ncbi:MAG: CNNM domain-containing protein [Kiritimatiellales bacterium]
MNLLWHLLFILFLILAAALYGGYETGGYLLNRIRLRSRVRSMDHSALRLQSVLADSYLFIFTVLIGHNIAVYLVSRSVTQLYLKSGLSGNAEPIWGFIPWNAETAATLTLMLPLFIFADIIPKNIFRRRADTLMYSLSGPLLLSWKILRPLTVALKMLFNLLTGGRGHSEALNGFSLSLQGLREYFSEETRREALSDYQHSMIGNLVAMHRVPARQIMQPVSNVAAVSLNATVSHALELMRARNVEQLAVYRGSVHNIIGVVNLFDLMAPALQSSDSIKSSLHKIVRLSADISLTHAFRRLRQSPSAPAAVTDLAFRTVGLLHLRDIARYIVQAS